jgi:hypothetical protein
LSLYPGHLRSNAQSQAGLLDILTSQHYLTRVCLLLSTTSILLIAYGTCHTCLFTALLLFSSACPASQMMKYATRLHPQSQIRKSRLRPPRELKVPSRHLSSALLTAYSLVSSIPGRIPFLLGVSGTLSPSSPVGRGGERSIEVVGAMAQVGGSRRGQGSRGCWG